MLNRKEIAIIIAASLVLALVISLMASWKVFFYTLLSIFLISLINIFAKKIAAFYFESEVEVKLWEIERYGYKAGWKFKKPIPAGIIFPLIVTALSFGNFTWMAPLVFDVKAKIYRVVKKHGLYSFSEMSEFHIGLIAAAGILANLFFAVLAYLIGTPIEMNFITLSIAFTFFNMLPISDLDGNKIFFGNLTLWSFLATLVLIGLSYVFLVI
ncbi:MAG: hypothetical protein AABX30_03665 [Nanoarchaeota archaeon]|mgnify:CR=1 FL=1